MPGDQAALAIALEVAGEDEGEAWEQPDLLGLPEDSQVVELREKRLARDGSRRGRNPGSRNKRTEDMVRLLLSQNKSPLLILAQMATARVDELAASLGCKKLEAWQEKRLAAIALLPYVHSKKPVEVNINERVVHLHMDLGDLDTGGESDLGLTAQIVDVVARDRAEDESAA